MQNTIDPEKKEMNLADQVSEMIEKMKGLQKEMEQLKEKIKANGTSSPAKPAHQH